MPDNIEILEKMSIFSVDNVLKQNKPNITESLNFLNVNAVNIATAESQWSKINLTKWNNTVDTPSFWSEVFNYRDSSGNRVFEEFANVAINILSLPYSNAEVERIFSQMNLVKNKARNRMKYMLTEMLRIRIGLSCNILFIHC